MDLTVTCWTLWVFPLSLSLFGFWFWFLSLTRRECYFLYPFIFLCCFYYCLTSIRIRFRIIGEDGIILLKEYDLIQFSQPTAVFCILYFSWARHATLSSIFHTWTLSTKKKKTKKIYNFNRNFHQIIFHKFINWRFFRFRFIYFPPTRKIAFNTTFFSMYFIFGTIFL